MIFSIIMALTKGLSENVNNLSLLHAPFVLGLVTGGAHDLLVHRRFDAGRDHRRLSCVEFIKANIKLESAAAASIADSKKVVEICTKYAQKGMLNIFIAVFFATLAFAFVEPFFSSAIFSPSPSSVCIKPSSWPTPAARGTTPRKSSKSR